MDNKFNFPKKKVPKILPSVISNEKYELVSLQKPKEIKLTKIPIVVYFPMVIKATYEIVLIPNTEKVILETKRPEPVKKPIKKKKVVKRKRIRRKLKLPMIIEESSYEIISVPDTERILLETKRPYIPKRIYRLETKELLSDLNADFYEELKEYFVLELNKEYSRSLRRLIAPSARNLIPYIIKVRRIEFSSFLLKLYNADFSTNSTMINFTFVSVDENGNYDFNYIFERIDGQLTIKIDYS